MSGRQLLQLGQGPVVANAFVTAVMVVTLLVGSKPREGVGAGAAGARRGQGMAVTGLRWSLPFRCVLETSDGAPAGDPWKGNLFDDVK